MGQGEQREGQRHRRRESKGEIVWERERDIHEISTLFEEVECACQ